jgi:hypothetical protein
VNAFGWPNVVGHQRIGPSGHPGRAQFKRLAILAAEHRGAQESDSGEPRLITKLIDRKPATEITAADSDSGLPNPDIADVQKDAKGRQ